MGIIKKVALAAFKDKKLLQVRTHKESHVFFTLGGKPEKGECEIECLKREVKEEIGCGLDESSIKFLTEFEDVAHGKDGVFVNIKMYEGNLIGSPKPSSEVVEIGYFDTRSDKKNLSTIAQRTIFPWLKAHGYIN
ncbi:MAG: NUDIX domain-containing protein [Candidatus Daviesbacteria bacterium]|nr:NUDIX domain-containing protein [Candidatus Daviesbacteria bacterium]